MYVDGDQVYLDFEIQQVTVNLVVNVGVILLLAQVQPRNVHGGLKRRTHTHHTRPHAGESHAWQWSSSQHITKQNSISFCTLTSMMAALLSRCLYRSYSTSLSFFMFLLLGCSSMAWKFTGSPYLHTTTQLCQGVDGFGWLGGWMGGWWLGRWVDEWMDGGTWMGRLVVG